MLSGDIKKIVIKTVQDFVKGQQERRSKLTDEDVKKFLSIAPRKYKFEKKTE